jgi:hypothetical protein
LRLHLRNLIAKPFCLRLQRVSAGTFALIFAVLS